MEMQCPRCKRIFKGENKYGVVAAVENHFKYCTLPMAFKLLMLPAIPLAAITTLGMIAFFLLAPLGYPFLFSTSLVADQEVLTWKQYRESIYGKKEISSHMPKKGE